MDYTRIKLKKIAQLMPSNKKLKVIDLGCHFGEVTSFIQKLGFNVLGIDNNGDVIELAKSRHPETKFKRIDVYHVDFSKYDIVVAWGLFEYILDLPRLIKKIEGEMKKNSILIFAVPNVCSLSKRLRSFAGINPNREKIPHITFTFKEVESLIKNLKFKNKDIYSTKADEIKNIGIPTPRNLSGNIIVRMIKWWKYP